jgi:hypothetical protein
VVLDLYRIQVAIDLAVDFTNAGIVDLIDLIDTGNRGDRVEKVLFIVIVIVGYLISLQQQRLYT